MRTFFSLICLSTFVKRTKSAFPLEASPDTPWEDLRILLSAPHILTQPKVDDWKEQCLKQLVKDSDIEVSNWLLFNQSSGICLDHLSCIYENCSWPFVPPGRSPFPNNTNPSVILQPFDDTDVHEGIMKLPSRVLHPRHASDIVKAVQFCKNHSVGITVKVAGHSYFGASTAKNTLLIKMSSHYPTYAADGYLKECRKVDIASYSALSMACKLALARKKNAILRVGGGEMFDQAYRAVSFDWNENPFITTKYHLVGGSGGTVGAAGGWMASGGMSGVTGMRQYGVGVDQVLHIEMILPDGSHVRFGPSEWIDNKPNIYPKTVSVTGYCNSNPLENDESKWNWTTCSNNINFGALWFAVRGGGGGTYGVVTSVYYQLHDYPGVLQALVISNSSFPVFDGWNTETYSVFTKTYIRFVLQFLYTPAVLNVTEDVSRGCMATQQWSLNPFVISYITCHIPSGSILVEKWKETLANETVIKSFQAVGIPDEMIQAFGNLFSLFFEPVSYAHILVMSPIAIGVPPGRLADLPSADIIPKLAGFPGYLDSTHTIFPLEVIRNRLEALLPTLTSDALASPKANSIYTIGGAVEYSSDEMNSLSPARRNGAFMKAVTRQDFREIYYKYFFGNSNMSAPFPGSACHNHANVFEMGPLKSNWTIPCPLHWEQYQRDELCVSQGEAFWGTTNLRRLEAIKATFDPSNLFICTAGVGYGPEPVAAALEEETSAPSVQDVQAPTSLGNNGSTTETKRQKTSSSVSTSIAAALLIVLPQLFLI